MATTEEIVVAARAVMKEMRANLTAGAVKDKLSGHPDNPCCPSCERMYAALMDAEKIIGTN